MFISKEEKGLFMCKVRVTEMSSFSLFWDSGSQADESGVILRTMSRDDGETLLVSRLIFSTSTHFYFSLSPFSQTFPERTLSNDLSFKTSHARCHTLKFQSSSFTLSQNPSKEEEYHIFKLILRFKGCLISWKR